MLENYKTDLNISNHRLLKTNVAKKTHSRLQTTVCRRGVMSVHPLMTLTVTYDPITLTDLLFLPNTHDSC